MFEAISMLSQIRVAEPWTTPAVVAGLLLFLGIGALIVGILTRFNGRR
jgi:hypothetical protein